MNEVVKQPVSKKTIIGVVAVILVVILGVASYFFYNWYNAKKIRDAMNDPGLRIVTGIMRLNRQKDTALNKEQAVKILPIVKDMKANQKDKKYIQEQVGKIQAVFNDNQKKALKRKRPAFAGNRNPNWSGAGGNRVGGGNWAGRGNFQGRRNMAAVGSGQVNLDQMYDRVITTLEDIANH